MIRIDQLIPSSCLLCKKLDFHQKPNLCKNCFDALPFPGFNCQRCAMPLLSNESVCGVCINQRLSYDGSYSPYLYKEGIKELINNLKHHQDICTLSTLATIFCDAYTNSIAPKPDFIIPIPLSRKRYLQRGFNQSSELGKIIERIIGIKSQDLYLVRIKDQLSQQGLKRVDRLKNLKNCFQVTHGYSEQLEGKVVALLDDVMTTGATMESAARELRKEKVKRIYAWSIARTDL